MRTALCEKLSINVPIVQAAMGGASCPALAAAVSNAGGLGMLALSWGDSEAVRRQIQETKRLTDRPFGVNLVLQWEQEQRLEICLEEGVRIVSFFWGDPAPLVRSVHDAGGVVLHTVGSAAAARNAVESGVDIIVAQGWEAGGHVQGQVATLALVPAVVDAVAPTPVVAAGGIADGRGLAAVLALGAAGAWIGTRFLASREAAIHPLYRDLLLKAAESDTFYSELFDGGWPNAPHRVLRNTTVENWLAAGCPAPGERPGEGEVIATSPPKREFVRYGSDTPLIDTQGAVEALSLWAGQGVALVRQSQTAKEIVIEIAEQARTAIHQLAELQ